MLSSIMRACKANRMNQQRWRKCRSHMKDAIVVSFSLEPGFDTITGDLTDWQIRPSLVVTVFCLPCTVFPHALFRLLFLIIFGCTTPVIIFFGRLQYTGVFLLCDGPKQDALRCSESAAFTEAFVTKDTHSILASAFLHLQAPPPSPTAAPAVPVCCYRRRRGPGPSVPGPNFEFGRWLFPASSPVRAALTRRAVTTNGHCCTNVGGRFQYSNFSSSFFFSKMITRTSYRHGWWHINHLKCLFSV